MGKPTQRTSHGRSRAAAVGGILAGLLVLAACTSTTGGTPTPASVSTVAPATVDLGHGLSVTPPAGAAVTAFVEPDSSVEECVLATGSVAEGDTTYQLQLVRSTCPQADQRALNGRHGEYLVPPSYALDTTAPVAVPTGSLVTFRQTYTECTNSCTDYTDSVGLVTLSKPADAQAPVLMILVPRKDSEHLAEIAALAQALTNN